MTVLYNLYFKMAVPVTHCQKIWWGCVGRSPKPLSYLHV